MRTSYVKFETKKNNGGWFRAEVMNYGEFDTDGYSVLCEYYNNGKAYTKNRSAHGFDKVSDALRAIADRMDEWESEEES